MAATISPIVKGGSVREELPRQHLVFPHTLLLEQVIIYMYVCMYVCKDSYLCMIKVRVRWCTCNL